jgi:hypothetical protein
MADFARILEDEFAGTCDDCGKGFYFCRCGVDEDPS